MYVLKINLSKKSYYIYIQRGLLDNIGKEIKGICKSRKIVLLTDLNIDRLYGELIVDNLRREGFDVYKIVLNPGESSKSIDTLQKVYSDLLEIGINRGDLIIVFGGGVIGDLGGFASATFLRGISFIQIPTTLLAQVDSSVGGKVAINFKGRKNIIGAFYHPEAVFIDPDLLNTLDIRYFNDGMAEIIKYGCIKDEKLFDNLSKYNKEELFDNIESIIYTCCKIKSEIVEKDEKDKGERMLLNFGHTIGHGIEAYFGYRYTHGEAVAMGMYEITRNSEYLGLTEKGTSKIIKEILIKYNLPYKVSDVDKSKLLNIVKVDKKSIGENMNIVLLKNIGKGYIKKIKADEIEKYIVGCP